MGEWFSALGPWLGNEFNPAPSCLAAQPGARAPGRRAASLREEGDAWAWAARAAPGAARTGAASGTILAARVGTGRGRAARA